MNLSLTKTRLFFLIALFINSILIWYLHDRFWCAQDDGAFIHVAERLSNGEVLNRDIQEVHAGYVNFINAFSLKIFGHDFLSLRYPLILIVILQSCLVFKIFERSGVGTAVVASLVPLLLGVSHFLNPNTHWYSLFLTIVITHSLIFISPQRSWRLPWLGFLLTTLFLVRQLSAILVGMAVITCLLLEASKERGPKKSLSFFLYIVMALGLSGYLISSTDISGILLFGLWPIFILLWSARKREIGYDELRGMIKGLGKGLALGFVPIVLYHLFNNSLLAWLTDSFAAAFTVMHEPFLREERCYPQLILEAAKTIFHAQDIKDIFQGFYWEALLFVSSVNGILLLSQLNQRKNFSSKELSLPIIAVFYAVISVHYQIPVYLYFSVGVSILAFLWLSSLSSERKRITSSILVAVLIVIAFNYYSSEPIPNTIKEIIYPPDKPIVYGAPEIPRLHLWVDGSDKKIYKNIIHIIQANSSHRETIFAIPNNAEIYFLTERKNPFRFFATDTGLRNPKDLKGVLNLLKGNQAPRIITYSPDDKRNTAYSREIMAYVRAHYHLIDDASGFEIYQHP